MWRARLTTKGSAGVDRPPVRRVHSVFGHDAGQHGAEQREASCTKSGPCSRVSAQEVLQLHSRAAFRNCGFSASVSLTREARNHQPEVLLPSTPRGRGVEGSSVGSSVSLNVPQCIGMNLAPARPSAASPSSR